VTSRLTRHPGHLSRAAVVLTPAVIRTLQEVGLGSAALHIIHVKVLSSAAAVRCGPDVCRAAAETETSADNSGVCNAMVRSAVAAAVAAPVVVTDAAPVAAVPFQLDAAAVAGHASRQPVFVTAVLGDATGAGVGHALAAAEAAVAVVAAWLSCTGGGTTLLVVTIPTADSAGANLLPTDSVGCGDLTFSVS